MDLWLGRWTSNREIAGSSPGRSAPRNNSGQVFTHTCASASVHQAVQERWLSPTKRASERPLSQFSRSRYYSTSNNSQMVQDRAIVTMVD